MDINRWEELGLLKAIKNHEKKKVIDIIAKKGFDKNFSKNGTSILMSAIFAKEEQITIHLIQSQICELNHQNKLGKTALMISTEYRQNEVALKLIENGCDMNVVSNYGMNALMTAIIYRQTSISLNLIENGCKLNLQNEMGNTALMFAIEYNQEKIVSKLIETGCDVNLSDIDGWNPLTIAIDYNLFDITFQLIECGCKISKTSLETSLVKKILKILNKRNQMVKDNITGIKIYNQFPKQLLTFLIRHDLEMLLKK
jgi:ankyrin repeat protein